MRAEVPKISVINRMHITKSEHIGQKKREQGTFFKKRRTSHGGTHL